MKIGKTAIFLIGKDKVEVCLKKKGYNYHLDHFLALAKKNKKMRKIINKFDMETLKNKPALVQETIVKALVEEGYIVFANLAPQIEGETFLFMGYVPKDIVPFQEEYLKDLKKEKMELLELGILNDLGNFEALNEGLSFKESIDDYLKIVGVSKSL